jgi:signal transduction histidine kinase
MRDIAIGIIVLFLILALIIVFCAVFINVYITKIKKYNKQLFEKELEKQKSVNAAITETQDQTLNQISQELHDDIGQQLTVINMQLEQLKLKQSEAAAGLEPISANLRGLSASVRELSHGLTSVAFDKNDLFSAFAKELKRCKKLGVDCHLEVNDQKAYTFPTDHKVILYRIFQEILNNVLKHSEASRFTVKAGNPRRPVLTFQDNGKGIANVQNAIFSNGMRNLRSRASVIDYEVDIHTGNHGTTITLQCK